MSCFRQNHDFAHRYFHPKIKRYINTKIWILSKYCIIQISRSYKRDAVNGDETPGPTFSVFSLYDLTSQPFSTVDPPWPHPIASIRLTDSPADIMGRFDDSQCGLGIVIERLSLLRLLLLLLLWRMLFTKLYRDICVLCSTITIALAANRIKTRRLKASLRKKSSNGKKLDTLDISFT